MNGIIFPGQGSQYTGMGKSFYDNFEIAKELFLRIDKILGFKISEVCFSGSQEQLKDTYFQQLAILSVSIVGYEVFKQKNIKVDFLSGLSLGEYTCLYPAEVLNLEDLFYLVSQRAKAMQEVAKASDSGMLAVIGLNFETLKKSATETGFYISNFNSSEQIVISLKNDQKASVKSLLENLGARVIELEVSGGFHSPFMEPAKERLRVALEKVKFSDAKIPIVSNYTAKAHIDKDEIKYNLLNQLTSPVLWKDCIEFMKNKGVDTFFEIGPSRILKNLVRKIDANLKVINIEKKEDLESL